MLKKEGVLGMEPHPQIRSESSTTPPRSTSPGLGVAKPGSMKRKKTANSQQRSSTTSSFNLRCASVVESIRAKYGAIDKDCILKTQFIKDRIMSDISYMLQQLDKKKIDEIDIGSLDVFYETVTDAEVLNIDVKWFRERLDEIREAITSNKEAEPILLRRNECLTRVEENKEKLKRLRAEMEMLEKQLNEDVSKTNFLDKSIKTLTTKFQHFQKTSLAGGLY